MTPEIAELLAWRNERIAAEGGPLFMSLPERWLDSPTWRCPNEHVSKRYLRTETRGDLCLACQAPVVMTFPEDEDGPRL